MSSFIFEERPYQTEAVSQVLKEFENGRESVLLESPVGSGKTIMGLLVIRELQERSGGKLRVSWVASRRHILQQTARINESFFHCRLNLVSVFASNPPKADLVVLDEAHHEATQSCLAMYESTGNARTLGLSATPLRTDRMRLSFQTSVRCCGIQKLIHMGILSPYHSCKLPEWNVELAAKVFCENPERWGKSLVFFQTIRECRAFQQLLAAQGIGCEVITAQSNRDSQLDAFIAGDVQAVANVSVLSEGFDLPELQSIFLRDASRLPTIQMAGRGLRRDPGKTHCNLVQSATSPYPVERIASPQESFRYMKNKWLSCSGNTRIILETLEESLRLLAERKTVLPVYLTSGRHVKEISLKSLSPFSRSSLSNLFNITGGK
ncbi:MAG: DEAD/DEAH box helicase family protein [Lentisphaeria bacterium]|nr:DEAD/DEAH box helicase family protein [Lentisphaeria bacterium]